MTVSHSVTLTSLDDVFICSYCLFASVKGGKGPIGPIGDLGTKGVEVMSLCYVVDHCVLFLHVKL